MATGTEKFLNYNGLVKLIGLIKNALSSAVGFKTNSFVKGIAGYGSGSAPSSTSGVNDTKNKLTGTYTTGKLDGTGTDVTNNEFTYIDTTYGNASSTKAGLMSSGHWSIVDALDDAAASSKGSSLIGYGKSIGGTTRTTVTDALDALGTATSHKLGYITYPGYVDDFVDGSTVSQESYEALVEAATSSDSVLLIDGAVAKVWDDGTYIHVAFVGNVDGSGSDYNHATVVKSGQHDIETFEGISISEFQSLYSDAVTSVKINNASTGVSKSGNEVNLSLKTINSNSIVGSGNVVINSDIALSSNLTIGGASKTNVQDALTALNTSKDETPLVVEFSVVNTGYALNRELSITNGVTTAQLNAAVAARRRIVAYIANYAVSSELAFNGIGELTAFAQNTQGGDYILSGIITGYISASTGSLPIRLAIRVFRMLNMQTGTAAWYSQEEQDVNYALSSFSVSSGDSSTTVDWGMGGFNIKEINGSTMLGVDNMVIDSSIGLSSNITVDGATFGTVQDTLTALNTLAAANKTAIQSIQSAGLTRTIVTSLPTTNISATTIYMILASNDTLNGGDPSTSASTTPYSSNNNSYNEYMYINSAWERIGSTEVNLDIDPITNDEIDTAWATTSAAA